MGRDNTGGPELRIMRRKNPSLCPSRNPTVCNVLHHTSLLYGDEFSYLRSHPERDLPAYEMGIANLLSSRGLKLERCGKRVALSVVFELIAIDVIVI